jgi:hypothetical protein
MTEILGRSGGGDTTKYDNAGLEPASGSLQVTPLTVALSLVSEHPGSTGKSVFNTNAYRSNGSNPKPTGPNGGRCIFQGVWGVHVSGSENTPGTPEVADHIYEKII